MPTAEGVFPKIGGDSLYYSEANRFASAPRYFFLGSTAPVGSATGIQTLGSVLFGAGSLTNPCQIDIFFGASGLGNQTGALFTVSGASTNAGVEAGSASDRVYGRATFLLGSPLKGYGEMTLAVKANNPNTGPAGGVFGGIEVVDMDTSQNLVLFFNLNNQDKADGSYQIISVREAGVYT